MSPTKVALFLVICVSCAFSEESKFDPKDLKTPQIKEIKADQNGESSRGFKNEKADVRMLSSADGLSSIFPKQSITRALPSRMYENYHQFPNGRYNQFQGQMPNYESLKYWKHGFDDPTFPDPGFNPNYFPNPPAPNQFVDQYPPHIYNNYPAVHPMPYFPPSYGQVRPNFQFPTPIPFPDSSFDINKPVGNMPSICLT